MGRASRKEAASAEPRGHWSETHPDRHLWTEAQRVHARMQTQAEYEALYGRGQAVAEGPDFFAMPETDFVRQYRAGKISLDDNALARLVHRRQDSMTWPLPGESPLAGDLAPEWTRRLQDPDCPEDAVSVLGAALADKDNMDRFWASLLRSREEALVQTPWERSWSRDDQYLYQKLLPAFYSSPESERLLADGSESEAWIESLVTSRRVEERFGSARDHHLALAKEVEGTNQEAGRRLRSRTRNWHEELGGHIGQENGDHGYVTFIEIPNQISTGKAASLEEAALEASRAGLVHLVEKQLLLAALQETGLERDAADRYFIHGGTTEEILGRSGKQAEDVLRDIGVLSHSQIQEIEGLVRQERHRNEEMYNRLTPSEREEMLYEKLAEGIRNASEEYVDTFVERQQMGAAGGIGITLFYALGKAFD